MSFNILHLGNITLGILNSSDAVGMLAGNLIISMAPELKQLAKILAVTMCAIGLALCGIGGLFVANQSELVVRIVGALMVFTVGMSVAFMNTPFGIYMQKLFQQINGAGVFNRDVVEYDIHSNRHSFLFLYFSVFSKWHHLYCIWYVDAWSYGLNNAKVYPYSNA